MYQRIPDTLEDALTMIKAALGAAKMAEAVGVSGSMVQKWTNPHHASLPSFDQMVLLDRACLKVTGQAPIQEIYQKKVGQNPGQPNLLQDLQTEMLDVQAATGALAQKVREVTCKTSASGEDLSQNEAIAVLQEVKNAIARLEDIQNLASQNVLALHSAGSGNCGALRS